MHAFKNSTNSLKNEMDAFENAVMLPPERPGQDHVICKKIFGKTKNTGKPHMSGVVSIPKPLSNIESMDMNIQVTVHAKNEDTRPRSRSLSRCEGAADSRKNNRHRTTTLPKKKVAVVDHKKSRSVHEETNMYNTKPWSEILRSSSNVPPRQTSKQRNNNIANSVDKTNNESKKVKSTGAFKPHKATEMQAVTKDSGIQLDLSGLASLNPVRTLQFLVGELHNSGENWGNSSSAILKMIEETLTRLAQDLAISTGSVTADKKLQPSLESLKKENMVLQNSMEELQRDNASLQRKLDEQIRVNVTLGQKINTLEIQLSQSEAEKARAQEEVEREKKQNMADKMLSEKMRNVAHLTSQPSNDLPQKREIHIDEKMINKLRDELRTTRDNYCSIKAAAAQLNMNYKHKMKVVQDILNNGFDFVRNDSVRLSEVVGQTPQTSMLQEEDPPEREMLKKEVGRGGEKLSDIDQCVASLLSKGVDSMVLPDLEQYMNSLVKSEGFPQLNVFQSFLSIPDQAETTIIQEEQN